MTAEELTTVHASIHAADESGNIIRLDQPLLISWERCTFTIPAGFECDGVSTPRALYTSVSPAIDPQTIRGAFAHDYIYRTQPPEWDRKMADEMLYDLCREDGLNWFRAQKMYWGLRLFGGKAWNDNKEKLK